jgi:hypothetical protein
VTGTDAVLVTKTAKSLLGSWTPPRAGFLEDVLIEAMRGLLSSVQNLSWGMESSSMRIDDSSCSVTAASGPLAKALALVLPDSKLPAFSS